MFLIQMDMISSSRKPFIVSGFVVEYENMKSKFQIYSQNIKFKINIIIYINNDIL